MTHVKICGITWAKNIPEAEALGVEYLGFVFAPSSPRSITADEVRALRPLVKSAAMIGIFDGQSAEEIERCVQHARLDGVQVYDEQLALSLSHLPIMVIRAFRGLPTSEVLTKAAATHAFILVDLPDGYDEHSIAFLGTLPASVRSKLFVAGKLNPDNVHAVVKGIQPFAVDCARGIESAPGIKDERLLASFISNARL